MPILTIYPSYMALRQWQQRRLADSPFIDGRRHLALSGFLDVCLAAAQHAGLLAGSGAPLRPMGDLDLAACRQAAAAAWRKAAPCGPGPAVLTAAAVEDVLSQLMDYLDPLADRAPALLRLLAAAPAGHHYRHLAEMYRVFTVVAHRQSLAAEAEANAAILALLRGPTADWPDCLRGADAVLFAGVRWLPPFLELVVQALAGRLGAARVRVSYVLDEHEQDWWGGNLLAQTGTVIFGGRRDDEDWRNYHAPPTSRRIEALLDLREGLAMRDPELAAPARAHVAFSASLGVYGEVEDMARRIVWATCRRNRPLRPGQIALVLRQPGDYADAVVNVFSRFGIPFYFRRGAPLSSLPVVQTVLNLARFSQSRSRNALVDLLHSPWLDWTGVLGAEIAPGALAKAIEAVGAETVLDAARLRARFRDWRPSGGQPGAWARAAGQVLALAAGQPDPPNLAAALEDLMERCRRLDVAGRLAAGPPDGPVSAAYLANQRGYAALQEALRLLQKHHASAAGGWADAAGILMRALSNLTLEDPVADDAGVWVLSPFDIAGLDFEMVMLAGLNAGAFPVIPAQSPLFSDRELFALRERLAADGAPLARAALPLSAARHSQENLLLLTAMAAARQTLVFSRMAVDESGAPLAPSVFFSALWRLAGWPALGADPDVPPDDYDQWRIRVAPEIFGAQWRKQRALVPAQRQPFAGESFLGALPLALCCAADESRQSLVLRPPAAPAALDDGAPPPGRVDLQIQHALAVDAARQEYFQRQDGILAGLNRPPALAAAPAAGGDPFGPAASGILRYAGALPPDLWRKLQPADADAPARLSVTSLQKLVNCPYRYFLEEVLGVREQAVNELEADAMDYGRLVHEIMKLGLHFFMDAEPDAAARMFSTPLRGEFSALRRPVWVGRAADGGWVCAPAAPVAALPEQFPAACLDQALAPRYREFFTALIAGLRRAWQDGPDPARAAARLPAAFAGWRMGLPAAAAVEWRRVELAVNKLLDAQLAADAANPEFRRCSALVEYEFGNQSSGAPDVELHDPADGARRLRLHGKIDRVDLLFSAAAPYALSAVLVVDYKKTARGRGRPEILAENIAAARDCQMPVYAMAAAARFTGGLAGAAAPPVRMLYLGYRDADDDLQRQFRGELLGLDGAPLSPETLRRICPPPYSSLPEAFAASVFAVLRRLEQGCFLVAAATCDYCPFDRICRFQPGVLAAAAAESGEEEP